MKKFVYVAEERNVRVNRSSEDLRATEQSNICLQDLVYHHNKLFMLYLCVFNQSIHAFSSIIGRGTIERENPPRKVPVWRMASTAAVQSVCVFLLCAYSRVLLYVACMWYVREQWRFLWVGSCDVGVYSVSAHFLLFWFVCTCSCDILDQVTFWR